MNVFIALKGTHFLFLFAFTAAGVVQCGGHKRLFFLSTDFKGASIETFTLIALEICIVDIEHTS